MRRCRAAGKCHSKLLDGCLSYRILHMQIVFCHVHIGMTHDALDGSEINAQGLHLRYISMAAAVGRQYPNFFHVFQGLLELVPEVGRVTGHSGLLYRLPDEFVVGIPEQPGTVADVLRNRHTAIAVIGLGRADGGSSFLHDQCLFDGDERPFFRDVTGFQGKQFLGPHARAKHQADAQADLIFRKILQKELHLVRSEGFLPLRGTLSHLLRKPHRVLVDQIIGFCLVEDLIQHAPALGKTGIGAAFLPEFFEELLNVIGFDIFDFSPGESVLEDAKGVAVILLGGGLDVNVNSFALYTFMYDQL